MKLLHVSIVILYHITLQIQQFKSNWTPPEHMAGLHSSLDCTIALWLQRLAVQKRNIADILQGKGMNNYIANLSEL